MAWEFNGILASVVSKTIGFRSLAVERGRDSICFNAVVDGGACGLLPTTVVDLTGKEPLLVRSGRGEPALIGL